MATDWKQVGYALDRQERTLQSQADRLLEQMDYGAEFPAADAECLREAIELVSEYEAAYKEAQQDAANHIWVCMQMYNGKACMSWVRKKSLKYRLT